MKTKNQSSLPSKYWLIIVIVICVILMGVERITGGNGPISFIANYTVIPMQKRYRICRTLYERSFR